MKKFLTLCLFLALSAPAAAHVLEEVWEKYSGIESGQRQEGRVAAPGELAGRNGGAGEDAFDYPWKYRHRTYEMHFGDPEALARGVYGLALYAGDISPKLPRGKFYRGVLGFHYSAAQIAGWLNDSVARHIALDPDESAFAGKMLVNGVIGLGQDGFRPGGSIDHVLGAAGGKKRSFAQNLRHERLHVFWDEDQEFQASSKAAWQALTEAEKENVRKILKNYNQGNEAQLIEEWAIGNAENSIMSIR